ncbi:hypothetical protein D9Q98_000697 [Chlorella vulgaris]|uniref:Uncharacterized protein n=1 Tax=Chlorella vulgaris TaxID=3077 RepID=A0A9D4TYK0_CHLVU|nr:hypothetical protein D9Q98_000697 [Chlorella vulgaris]
MLGPSLREALAVAQLLHKRCRAAVQGVQQKCTELEQQVERLQATAAAPPTPPPLQTPLVQLLAAQPLMPSTQAAAAQGSSAEADHKTLQRQLQSLAVWHRAAASLPPDLQAVLSQVQRYLLLGELAGPSGAGSLPVAALLERTPVGAILELAADILRTHAAAATAAAAAAAAAAAPTPTPTVVPSPMSSQLSPAHGRLLDAAAACLVHLCDRPGHTALEADYADLQHFCTFVLQLAVSPPQTAAPCLAVCTPDQQPAAAGRGQPQEQSQGTQAEGLADLGQPTCQLAQHLLGVLRQSASAGTVLLSAAAPQARSCMEALVAAITGEQLPPLCNFDGSIAASCEQPPGGAEAAGEEARLLHAFTQLGHQLSSGLRLLPLWVSAMGLRNDAFMQELAGAILSARDASELISVTHPAAARQMQRVAAHMVGALQLIAAQGGGACADPLRE